MVAELVLAVVATTESCLRLGRKMLDAYRAYRDSDEIVADKFITIEGVWLRLESQLTFLGKISSHLDQRLVESQFKILQRLEGKLLQVSSQLDMPESTYMRKLKVALAKNKIDDLVTEMEEWQRRFDPTWFVITLIGDKVIDTELWERQREATAETFNTGPLHSMLALRNAIRPSSHAEDEEDASKSLNLNVNLPSEGLESAAITLIPFSSARMVVRKGSDKLLIVDTVNDLGGNLSQTKHLVENLARKLKKVDSFRFSLLPCRGVLKRRDTRSRILTMDLVFSTPQGSRPPQSLRKILMEQKPVSATAVVSIAKQLVQSISYVHACDFVHKNIRPESILVFPGDDSPLCSSFLTGFSQFRESHFQTMLEGDYGWHLNLYRHPQRQGKLVQNRYIMQHDIYSLGVCLLEIGLWKSFVWYTGDGYNDDPSPGLALGLHLSDQDFRTMGTAARLEIKEHLVDIARQDLRPRLGDIYTNIVVACLTCLDPGNTVFGDEEELQDEDGILIGVRYIEKVLLRMADISI